MTKRVVLLALCLVMPSGLAKDKKKNLLPAYVLEAHTVAVMIDPHAGMDIEDPRANENAQKDVEAALAKWGRYEPTLAYRSADLVIVIRKGNSHWVDQTIPDARQNNRAGVITTTDNSIGIGGQRTPGMGQQPRAGDTGPQTEAGQLDDSFFVYKGQTESPADAPSVWRYVRKDGLRPGEVPAVEAFRKAVDDTEKALAKP